MTWTHAALLAALAIPPAGDGIEWQYGPIEAALAKAREHGQLTMIYFWGEGSEYSGKLYQETLTDERAEPLLAKMVCYSAKHSEETAPLFERYAIATLPTMLFVDGDGGPEDIITGFIPVEDFVTECDRVQRLDGTVTGFRRAVAAAKPGSSEQLELLFKLAGKLLDVNDQDGHDAQLEVIRERDPKGATEVGARIILWDTERSLFEHGEGQDGSGADGDAYETLASLDLAPLYSLARKLRPKTIRYETWNRIANLEAQREKLAEACDALVQARKLVPGDQAVDFFDSSARFIFQIDARITSKERKIALELAQAGVKAIEAMLEQADGDEIGPEDANAVRANGMSTLAMAYHINRKHDQALSAARRAVELAPNDRTRAILARVEKGHD